ncbi:MAG: hypothetical protein LBR83_05790, partial [Clostridiales bacterium]|nr:hypothetical protein [Clostridiales bacterium]
MNKKIALLLAVIFAAGMFPPVAVSAAVAPAYPMRQAPVSTITMQVESELYSDNYDLALAWNLPVFNSQTDRDTAAIPPAVGYPERYKIMYRNRTANEAYARNPIKELDRDSDPNNVIELDTDSASYTLAPGSLYEFRVVPYHTNTYLVTDPDGTTRRELREVSPAESDAREKRVALLTDIKVSAVGRGSELDVTWTNPTWGGAPVFTEYAIMYEVFNPDSEGEVGLIQWNLDHVVNVNDCEPGEEPGTLKTTINANNLIPGWQYHVRVEPLINGEKVRAVEGEDGRGAGAGDRHTVRISNVDYYFAYGDYQYITEKTAFINPMLHLEMESKDMLRLFWDSLKGSPSLQGIVRIEIEEWEYDPLEPDEVTDLSKRIGAIGYIDGEYNIYNINDWRINLEDLPPEPKAYKIAFYQPGDTVETATRTNIVYYNPSMADFAPYKPDIKLFAQQPGELALQLHWLAFARRPYLPTEEENVNAEFNTYIDPNVRYNIYVTDNDANFTSLTEPLYQVEPSALDLGGFDNLAPDGSVISRDPVYLLRQPYITSYVTRDADGNFVTLPLAANKVYFVKIEAVRLPSGISAREPAFASTYIPPVEDLETIPLMIAAPPLRAGEDKGMDYITVEWDIKYLEIYDAATDTWHAAVGVKDGQLVYGKSALDLNSTGATGFSINDYLKENRMDLYEEMIRTITVDNNEDPENVPAYVDAFLGRVEALLAPVLGSAPRLRVIDLSKASYEIHTVAYDVMMSLGGYEPYRRATLDDFTPEQAANSANWVPIDPAHSTAGATIGTYRYRVSAAQNPAGPLTENTAYVVYVRPYEIF